MAECGLCLSRSGYRCKHDGDPSNCIRGTDFLRHLIEYQLLKNSAACGRLKRSEHKIRQAFAGRCRGKSERFRPMWVICGLSSYFGLLSPEWTRHCISLDTLSWHWLAEACVACLLNEVNRRTIWRCQLYAYVHVSILPNFVMYCILFCDMTHWIRHCWITNRELTKVSVQHYVIQ